MLNPPSLEGRTKMSLFTSGFLPDRKKRQIPCSICLTAQDGMESEVAQYQRVEVSRSLMTDVFLL